MMTDRDWKVLLLGGGSGTGKTHAAAELAKQLDIQHLQADDIRLALQYAGGRESEPSLWFFEGDEPWATNTPSQLTTAHQRMSRRACDGLGIVVSKHVALDDPIILEGDDLLPEFAVKMIEEYGSEVRAVYLHEDDIDVLRANMIARDRGIRRRDPSTQEAMVELARADGDRLRQAAERHDFPIVASRPLGTLSNRIIKALA